MKWFFSTVNETGWSKYKESTCYSYSLNGEDLKSGHKSKFEAVDYKIIKWGSENMKFKVGDRIKAIDDRYTFTNKENGFIGEVVELLDERSPIEYKDLLVRDLNSQITYRVNSRHFELIEPTEFTFQEVIARIKEDETYVCTNFACNAQEIRRNKEGGIVLTIPSQSMYIKDEVHIPLGIKFKLQEPKKKVNIYRVEHKQDGKKYDFISNETRLLQCYEFVVCDTSQGKSYGRIVDIEERELAEEEYLKYKECWRS